MSDAVSPCRACGAPPRPSDLDAARGVRVCSFCGALARGAGPAADSPRPRVPRPSGVRLEETGWGVRIVRRWFTPGVLLLVGFCAVWFAGLALFYAAAGGADAPPLFRLLPLVHVAVGAAVGYAALAGLVNRTVVEADRGEIRVRHGPLPWPGGLAIEASEATHVFVTEKVRRGRSGGEWRTYTVNLLDREGRRRRLVGGMITDAEQALYIEQELERALGLPDQPVRGEYGR